MSQDNKTLGRFELTGIPPAPRGVPQVEVTFDIDANGIVHVTAKDLGTGKQQDIRITASSGLSEEEIKRMVDEAETYASEDQQRKERVEKVNTAETLVYSTEKTLEEVGDALDADKKAEVEQALGTLREALTGEDVAAIDTATEELTKASHALAEALYAKNAQQAASGEAGDGQAHGEQGGDGSDDDNVVDAEYEEVQDNK